MKIPVLTEKVLALYLLYLIFAKALGLFDLNTSLEYSQISPTGNRVFWLLLFFISMTLLLKIVHKNFWKIPTQNLSLITPITLIIIYIFLSIFWSNYPEVTLRRAVLQLTVIFSVIFLVRQYANIEETFKAIYRILLIILILNFLTFFVGVPFDTYATGFKGIYSAKNIAGLVSSIALLVGVYLSFYEKSASTKKIFLYLYLTGWTVTLLISLSKTSIALVILSPLLTYLIIHITQKSIWNFNFKSSLIASVILIFALPFTGINLYDLVINAGLQLGFTGRDLIWTLMFQDFEKYWVLGHGYGAFWDINEGISLLDTDSKLEFLSFIVQGHNGYLDLVLTMGILGLLLYLIWLIQIFKHAFSTTSYNHQQRFILITLLVFVLLHNITESSLFRGDHLIWIIHLIIFGLLLKRHKFKAINPV